MHGNENVMRLNGIFSRELERCAFTRIIFSKPRTAKIIRISAELFMQTDEVVVQFSYLLHDNKIVHENFGKDDAITESLRILQDDCYFCNIVAPDGTCEIKYSKKNKLAVCDKLAESAKICTAVREHNKQKRVPLSDSTRYGKLLYYLDLADATGALLPSRRSKYNQINRFIEILADAVAKLPDKELSIVDLCCGKAYLSLAAHEWLNNNSFVPQTTAVDLKSDVISALSTIVHNAKISNFELLTADIIKFAKPRSNIDVVMSLHACNTATDIVIAKALTWDAKVILCSPCCHHELASLYNSSYLSEFCQYPLLKQRFAEIATDAMRANILKACGYDVQILEFVDKEDSHKNTLIRAVKKRSVDYQSNTFKNAICELDRIYDKLGGKLMLRKLIGEIAKV